MDYSRLEEGAVARTWYEKAREIPELDQDDALAVYQFMSYWVAFNCLFEKYDSDDNEREKIKRYIRTIDSSLMEYNPQDDLTSMKEIIRKPVIDVRFAEKKRYSGEYDDKGTTSEALDFLREMDRKYSETRRNKRGETYLWEPNRFARQNFQKIERLIKGQVKYDLDTVSALFLTIYQVRCNLFHGSKSPYSTRDIKLVKESSFLLMQYLDKVFHS